MKIIIISGPSGSGKTTLSKKILKKLKCGIILNTDNYYKTGIISNLSSKIVNSYFDRTISFNKKLFIRDLDFILENGYSNFAYKYNFKKKTIKKIYKKVKLVKYIVIEGIFGREILNKLLSRNCILIKLKTKKKYCMKRILKRDFKKRGKSKTIAKKDFLKAWQLFYKNETKHKSISTLKKISITKKPNIKLLIKRIYNILN
tara:strand:+ start:59 stop:664 length:606 start_codon:yes stop_codon:yes gene_type:complete